MPRAEFVAVCDADAATAHARAAAWGVPAGRVFTDYQELLALPDVDLVEILLPHHLHYQPTLDAAAAGKHISVQKPMALTVAQADEMIAAAKRAGVIFKVFENFIFYPPVLARQGADRCRGDRRPALHPHQEQRRHQPQRLAHSRPRPRHGASSPEKSAAARWFLTMATTSSRWPGISWAMAEEVHAWIGRLEAPLGGHRILDSPAIVSWKFPGNRYGSLEVVYSPELVLDTHHYAQDDRIEITGTKGVIWITRGHGKMMDVPPVVLYHDRKTLHLLGHAGRLGAQLHQLDAPLHRRLLRRRAAQPDRRAGARDPALRPGGAGIGSRRRGSAFVAASPNPRYN